MNQKHPGIKNQSCIISCSCTLVSQTAKVPPILKQKQIDVRKKPSDNLHIYLIMSIVYVICNGLDVLVFDSCTLMSEPVNTQNQRFISYNHLFAILQRNKILILCKMGITPHEKRNIPRENILHTWLVGLFDPLTASPWWVPWVFTIGH